VVEALWIDRITTPEARILVGRAGTVPYFAHRYTIDFLGKSDRHIAREQAQREDYGLGRYIEFRPGHMKYDYAYSVGELKPDLVAFEFFQHTERARPYLVGNYTPLSFRTKCLDFRNDSKNILWGEVQPDTTRNCFIP
jgi:hypothetical protein